MPRFKFTTLCLLAAVCAVMLAAVPGDAAAKDKGICDKIVPLPEKGCVTSRDVKDDSLTREDMKAEAGADAVEGLVVFRVIPKKRVNYATVELTAPKNGKVMVTAHVGMSGVDEGGTLECEVTKGKGLGDVASESFRGSVAEEAKSQEDMLFSWIFYASKGTTRFNLVCRRIQGMKKTLGFTYFLVAEFYQF